MNSITGSEFRRLALSYEGVVEVAHFERTAFRARRIFASLAADQKTANLYLTPEEQEFRCSVLPDAFSPVANKWGARGWTEVDLGKLAREDLEPALKVAWTNGGGIDSDD
jgi:hypothetical protein